MAAAPETYDLTQITSFLSRVLALNFPEPLWVAAELAQADRSRGHQWLTLVQKDGTSDEIVAQQPAVVWESQLRELRRTHGVKVLRDIFQQGMSVRLRVRMSFHDRYGMRLVVEDVDPTHTIGALERRRQQTLQQLAAADLLDRNATRPLSPVARRLAVISSDTAAGLADFTDQLNANPYGYHFETKVFTAAMQGLRTSAEVIARLREIDRFWLDTYDAVVIVRGGGGRTDLAAFDEEQLCRAVAEFPLPVLVGIGHETDDTVLDRVAHRSLKTPTATAAFLVDRLAAAEGRTRQLGRRIAQTAAQIVSHERPRLDRLATGIRQAATFTVRGEEQRLEQIRRELQRLPRMALRDAAEQLRHYQELLTALRPETTLERGYALVSQDGRIVTDPALLRPGEVTVRLREGETTLEKQAE